MRNRTWTFYGEVKGRYVEKDDDKKTDVGESEDRVPKEPAVTKPPVPAAERPVSADKPQTPVPIIPESEQSIPVPLEEK